MRFHLIDRVDECDPGKSIRARKVTSRSEDYWEEHHGRLVMPPPFVLEALCQAGTWLIMITTDRRKRAALLSIGSVDWFADVTPGDVLLLEGQCDSFGEDTAVVSGRATVDGATILEAQEIMCALIDASDLADLDETRRLQMQLTRTAQ